MICNVSYGEHLAVEYNNINIYLYQAHDFLSALNIYIKKDFDALHIKCFAKIDFFLEILDNFMPENIYSKKNLL